CGDGRLRHPADRPAGAPYPGASENLPRGGRFGPRAGREMQRLLLEPVLLLDDQHDLRRVFQRLQAGADFPLSGWLVRSFRYGDRLHSPRALTGDAMNKVWLGTLLLLASAVAYSTAGFFTRLIEVDAWTLLFWRGLFGGSFLAVVVAVQQRGHLWRSIRAMGWEGVVVAICSALATVCFLNAMRLTAVAARMATVP